MRKKSRSRKGRPQALKRGYNLNDIAAQVNSRPSHSCTAPSFSAAAKLVFFPQAMRTRVFPQPVKSCPSQNLRE